MTTQLYLARGIVEGRVHTEQDHALVRTVELARHAAAPRRPGAAPQRRLSQPQRADGPTALAGCAP